MSRLLMSMSLQKANKTVEDVARVLKRGAEVKAELLQVRLQFGSETWSAML